MAHFVSDHWGELIWLARFVAPHRDAAIAEEIVQEAVASILKNDVALPVADHRSFAFLSCWIRNVGHNRRRREQIRRTEALVDEHLVGDSNDVDPWNAASKIFAERDVRMALETLSAAEREVMELHHFDGCTFEEIAHERRCSPKTAKELHRRGKRKVREALNDRYGL